MKRRHAVAVVAVLGLLLLVRWWWLIAPEPRIENGHASPHAARTSVQMPPVLQPNDHPVAALPASAAPSDSLAEVRCPLRMADPVEGKVEFALELESPMPDTTRWALAGGRVQDGMLIVLDGAPGSLHRGHVTVPGYLEADVAWSPRPDGGFDCPALQLRQGAAIVGRVHPPPRNGDDDVYVRGCDGFTRVAADGTFYLEGATEPCELAAERQDGWYAVKSSFVRVVPRLGEEIEVDLYLPESLQAGLGATIDASADGMVVQGVRSGSAAALAGIHAGDIIVSVDGSDVAGRSEEEFASLTRGNVNTQVVVEVLADGVRRARTLTRVFVGPERVPVSVPSGVKWEPDPGAWIPQDDDGAIGVE
jgi:hypothetical protein